MRTHSPSSISLLAVSLALVAFSHSTALAQGTLEAWGDDTLAQPISGTPTGTGFVQAAAGSRFFVAVNVDGTLSAWGIDGDGQVSNAPTGGGFVKVAAGDRHALALRTDGSIVSWGYSNYGLVASTPTGTGYTDISAGGYHSVAVAADGSIDCWGDDGGYWGGGGTFWPGDVVNGAPTGTGFSSVVAGQDNTIAMRPNGSMVGWGSYPAGGQSITSTLPLGPGFLDVSCAIGHALALKGDGSLFTFGNSTTIHQDGLRANMPTDAGYTRVFTGPRFSGALRVDGSLIVWGASTPPFAAAGAPLGPGVIDVSVANWVAIAIRGTSDGTPYCSGDGTGAACPCGNDGAAGEGCANSAGEGAALIATGLPKFSADTFQLHVSGVPGARPGMILRGNNQVAMPVGDGILCTAGGTQRSQVQVTSGGFTTFSDFGGAGFGATANAGSPTNYQFWYRDPLNACSGAGFNFTNGLSVSFVP